VASTASGLQPGLWTSRLLVGTLEGLGIITGWLFQEPDGSQRKISTFGDAFFGHLLTLQDEDPTLFEPNCDILDDFGLPWPANYMGNECRGGADIDWINHWNTGGNEIVDAPMHVIYAEQKQMIETFLCFSAAL
jgi:hypothetical protein